MTNYKKSLSILDELEAEVNQVARDVAEVVLETAIKETPEDSGRLAGNWVVGVDKRNQSVDDERRKSQALSEGSNAIKSAKKKDFPDINISNNLDYAGFVDTGTASQRPRNMSAKAVQKGANDGSIR